MKSGSLSEIGEFFKLGTPIVPPFETSEPLIFLYNNIHQEIVVGIGAVYPSNDNMIALNSVTLVNFGTGKVHYSESNSIGIEGTNFYSLDKDIFERLKKALGDLGYTNERLDEVVDLELFEDLLR